MSLTKKLSNVPAQVANAISGELNRMGPRERRLLGLLLAAVVLAIVVGGGLLTAQSLRGLAEKNADTREALAAIALHRDEFLEAKSRMDTQERRIGNQAPQLAADLESAATAVGIQIPETAPRPATPAGKRYLEHSVDVTLRQVDLLALARFLEKVETGQRVIVVSRMNVKRAFTDGEKLNVSLTATAFERVADSERSGAGAGRRGRS